MHAGNLIMRLLRDCRGTSTVEMGLICAMIILAMMLALEGFGAESTEMWNMIKDQTVAASRGSTA